MDPIRSSTPPAAEESADWHALVDGQLSPEKAKALRARLHGDEAAEATLAHWETQRRQLQSLHRDMLHAPVPEHLLALAHRTGQRSATGAAWWRWGGMAASVLLAFALGWAGRGQWPTMGQHPSEGLAALPALKTPNQPEQRFAYQAAVAHAVYQPEVRHPVEVSAAQQDHLVQWLSKRLGRPLHIPVLAPQGYELVGGRLLPGDTGVRAQFMYQNGAGQRITLYLGGVTPSSPTATATPAATADKVMPDQAHSATLASPSTAFQFVNEGPVPGFYWTDAGFGYALSGQLSRAELLGLATAVYPQLNP
jgi:anti-sigma factor RsiW